MLFNANFVVFWVQKMVVEPTTWVQNALDTSQMCVFII